MGIDLIVAGESNAEFWDKIVESSPHGTLFHTWKCLRIMGGAGNERLHRFYSKFNPNLVVSFWAKKYSSFISKLIFDIAEKIMLKNTSN